MAWLQLILIYIKSKFNYLLLAFMSNLYDLIILGQENDILFFYENFFALNFGYHLLCFDILKIGSVCESLCC